MEFEWDPARNAATERARGFGFDLAVDVFFDSDRVERVDLRREYGEVRRQTIGAVEGRVYFVVFTRRGNRVRVISLRRAHDHEEKSYDAGPPHGGWQAPAREA